MRKHRFRRRAAVVARACACVSSVVARATRTQGRFRAGKERTDEGHCTRRVGILMCTVAPYRRGILLPAAFADLPPDEYPIWNTQYPSAKYLRRTLLGIPPSAGSSLVIPCCSESHQRRDWLLDIPLHLPLEPGTPVLPEAAFFGRGGGAVDKRARHCVELASKEPRLRA